MPNKPTVEADSLIHCRFHTIAWGQLRTDTLLISCKVDPAGAWDMTSNILSVFPAVHISCIRFGMNEKNDEITEQLVGRLGVLDPIEVYFMNPWFS